MGIGERKARLNSIVRGWINHFKLADAKNLLQRLDEWIRRRIRMATWKKWKQNCRDAVQVEPASCARRLPMKLRSPSTVLTRSTAGTTSSELRQSGSPRDQTQRMIFAPRFPDKPDHPPAPTASHGPFSAAERSWSPSFFVARKTCLIVQRAVPAVKHRHRSGLTVAGVSDIPLPQQRVDPAIFARAVLHFLLEEP